MLEQRAILLARARGFFADGGVLEVDTPMVVNAPVSDVNIHSALVDLGAPLTGAGAGQAVAAGSAEARRAFFLHTSPEYAMKRLLAAGSGDIYQICHVVRGFERGRFHNAEFTLVEWYRLGFTLDDLMNEVDALVRALLGPVASGHASERITYREAFIRELQLDPFVAGLDELGEAARQSGFAGADSKGPADVPAAPTVGAATSAGAAKSVGSASHPHRDELLDFLMGAVVGPRLGANALTFVHGYPATQAALARLDPHDPRAALRFELYCEGVELANGFNELASATEQRARFTHDIAERRRMGLPAFPPDEFLLAALEAGLPECSGVALGFDRTLMLATGAKTIDEVLPFPTERA
ncbi:MAG: Elongation factor P--(R)-beta-lysine ligase [Gammaproteobacteria bacterium]|nr:Elongation factor P--(R)-beta-lysine ligase [Gammaproteobacteria bacterium]